MAAPESAGYVRIPTEGSSRALYGKTSARGNLVLVLESTAQLASLRRPPPSGFVTPAQARGVPGAAPTTFRGEATEGVTTPKATLPEAPNLREQRMRLSRGIYSHPGILELPLNLPPRPLEAVRAQREEYSTLVLPAEILEALRDYYGRRGAAKVTYAEAVNAAAYAIYTAKLSALPSGRATIGRYVTPATVAVGSPKWVIEQLAATAAPGLGVRGGALAPGQFPRTWTPSNLPGQFPVTYSTVVAVLFFVHAGVHLSREYFANLMQQNGWHPCGTAGVFSTLYPSLAEAESAEPTISSRAGTYLPETSEVVYCPPPRSFPLPPAAPATRPLTPPPPPPLTRRRPATVAPPPRYRRLD